MHPLIFRLGRPSLPTLGHLTVLCPKIATKTRLARAPSTIEAQKDSRVQVKKTNYLRDLTGNLPVELFKSAISEGLLNISVKTALEIAQKSIRVLSNPDFISISKETGFVLVAFILLRSPQHQPLANLMINALVEDGNLLAHRYYLFDAIRRGAFSRVPPSKRGMSRDNPQHEWTDSEPLGYVIGGLVLREQGQFAASEQMIRYAMDFSEPLDDPSQSYDALFPHKVTPPWKAYSELMTSLGRHQAAKEAITIGATEYENASAYKSLLRDVLQEGDMIKYEEYLLKVAMSNDAASCHQLGNLYLTLYLLKEGSKGVPPHNDENESSPDSQLAGKYTKEECRQLSSEWYELAIANGFAKAALVMAGLLRRENKSQEGQKYLAIAEADSTCAEDAKKLRNSWSRPDFSPDIQKDLM